MKSNRDRTHTLDTIADGFTMLANLAGIILDDIGAARGEPEQQHHRRPRLHDDIRDTPPAEAVTMQPDPLNDPARDYADPTGERAVKADPASRDLAEIDKRLDRARTDLDVLTRIFQRHQAARTPAQIRDVRKVAEETQVDGDEWCASHMRVHTLEPIELQPSGAPYYRGMCRRCGSLLARLKADHPKRFRHYKFPPIELVAIMTHRSVRESDVAELVGPQHRKRKTVKHRPGEDRKRRSA